MAGAKHVDVDVIVTKDESAPDGVRFKLSSDLGSSDRLKFKNDKHPGFVVNFDIKDDDQTGVLFLLEPDQAMWVRTFQDGDPDPCPRSSMHWDQFEATEVKQQGKRLVVRNLNEFEQKFAFSLRFSKPGSANPILYDPIGENENGGGGEISAFAIGGGVLLIGAALFAAIKLLGD